MALQMSFSEYLAALPSVAHSASPTTGCPLVQHASRHPSRRTASDSVRVGVASMPRTAVPERLHAAATMERQPSGHGGSTGWSCGRENDWNPAQ